MPRNRRGLPAAALLTALVLVAAACGGDGGDDGAERSANDEDADSTTSSTTTTTLAPGPFAPFTGEEVADRPELLEQPAMVVKISNNDANSLAALTGIDRADIVIEERIEDRATRFFVLFHSDLPDEVGAIRSGRSSDLDLFGALGTPILVYSGANPGVQGQLNAVQARGDVVLVVDDGRGVDLYRDDSLARPDNLFADPTDVLDKFADRAGAPAPMVSFITPDADGRAPGDIGLGVTVTGRDVVSFVFVPGRGYVRVQDDVIHVTSDGDPLAVENVVILETGYDRSPIDPESIDAVTTGTGAASVLIGGELWTGTWERPERTDSYRLLDDDGAEILLDPGQTWISLAPAETYEFEVDAEIAEVARAVDG